MHRRGFSLIEATLSIALVGMMATAALAVVAGARRAEQMAADRVRAQLLAEELLSEITPLLYKEPGSITLGADSAERTDTRSTWDDIDDADGYSESTLRDRSGKAHAGLTGWTRTVDVKWIGALDLLGIVIADSGIKRVTVTLSRNGKVVLKAVAVRTADRENFE